MMITRVLLEIVRVNGPEVGLARNIKFPLGPFLECIIPSIAVYDPKSTATSDNFLQKCYPRRYPLQLLLPVGPELLASPVVSDKTSSAGSSWLIRTQTRRIAKGPMLRRIPGVFEMHRF